MTSVPAPKRVEAAAVRGLPILMILASTLIFALSDVAAKYLVGRIPPFEVQWLRSVVVAILSIGFLVAQHGPGIFRSRHPILQITRGSCITIASILFLTGLSSLSVAEATAINFVWPLLVTVFSALLLKEKIGIRRTLATAVGFCGMLLIIRPGSGVFQPAAFYPFAAAVVWALASVLTRQLGRDEAAGTTIIWSALVPLAISSLAMPFVFIMPTMRELSLGFLVGVGSAIAHALVVHAFQRASASALAPFSYVQLVWAVALGYLFFGSLPDAWVLAGAVVIAASGIYTAHRERVRRLAEDKNRV
jgi:drug/metabolite transporter (DMT)-like permease